jgi:hypothetical protein
MSLHTAGDFILTRSAILQSSASFIRQESMAELGHTGNDYQYETRSFIRPKTGQPADLPGNILRDKDAAPCQSVERASSPCRACQLDVSSINQSHHNPKINSNGSAYS